jgi:outer membrane protein OmpA-like peptidoglycan-associated protein
VGDNDPDRSRGRWPAWVPLLGAALLVPTVLAGLTQLWPRPQLQDQLTRAGGAALVAAQLPDAGLVLSGRDATISGLEPGESSRAVDAVRAVAGVRIATAPTPVGTPGAPAAVLAAPEPIVAPPTGAGAGGTGTEATGTGGTGTEATGTGGTGTGGTSPGELADAGKQQLQGDVGRLLAASPLSFGPDSPALTAPGSATAARLLELVRAAPGARLQIDGFVATGKGNGRLTAQQLSGQRATTIRDVLLAGGIPADGLTARGLGEGNAPAAKAAGRRVEITVV